MVNHLEKINIDIFQETEKSSKVPIVKIPCNRDDLELTTHHLIILHVLNNSDFQLVKIYCGSTCSIAVVQMSFHCVALFAGVQNVDYFRVIVWSC